MHILFALRDTHQPQDSIAAVRFADHTTQEHDVLLSLQVDTMDRFRDKLRVLKFFSALVEEPVAQLGHDTGLSSDSSLHVLDLGFSLVPRSSERSRSSDCMLLQKPSARRAHRALLDNNCGASISQAVLLCNTTAGTDAEHHTTSDEPRNETDMFRSQTLLPGRLGLAVPIGLSLSSVLHAITARRREYIAGGSISKLRRVHMMISEQQQGKGQSFRCSNCDIFPAPTL